MSTKLYVGNLPYETSETDLQALFERMFSPTRPALSQVTEDVRRRASVLDAVREDLTRLRRRVGARDGARLDEHLESIREVERQLTQVPVSGPVCPTPDAPGPITVLVSHFSR